MQLTTRKPNNNTGDDNLIPLINIVFLMLIFFMVAGKISKTDTVDIAPPEANNTVPAASNHDTIYIQADGSFVLNDTPVDAQALTAAMTDYKSEHPVAIKAEKTSHAKDLDQVIDILQTVGISKITLYAIALNNTGQR